MRIGMWAGACAVLLAGCGVGVPPLAGNWRAPSFVDLETSCGGAARDWGDDAVPVYSTLYDAYVAKRYRGLTETKLLCVRKRTFSALRGAELGAACRVDRVFQRRTRAGHQLARGGRSDAARRLTRERTRGGREAESGAAGNPAGARVIWNGGAAGAS